MKKISVIKKIISDLEAQLEVARGASTDAAEYATHEESRADSKWDTQGLEASYLAAGQAAQAKTITNALHILQSLLEELETDCSRVTPGALIQCDLGGFKEWFFLSPAGGGIIVEVDSSEVTVITPQSPIALQILDKAEGATFTLANGSIGRILAVS